MARARNIKPALFKNEVLGVADPMATLLFEGLWLLADREGRLEDRVLRIKAELFPYRDNVNVDALLSWLAGEGFIHRYVVDGKRYIEVDSFVKHQNPHKNEPPSEIPSKSDGSSTSDKIGTTPDKIGIAPADSLSLDSGFLTPDSLSTVTPPASPAEDLFAKFWKLYPNKKGKAAAEKAWAKLRVSRGLFDQMLSALSKQALTPDWTKDKGRFVPHPATWLNGKRWEDEIPDAPGSNVHPFPHSRHTGFDQRDYKSSLKRREDGSYAI